MILFYF